MYHYPSLIRQINDFSYYRERTTREIPLFIPIRISIKKRFFFHVMDQIDLASITLERKHIGIQTKANG